MNGSWHFDKAEELAQRAAGWPDFDRWDMTKDERVARAAADAALAQAHATLALVAATWDGQGA